MRLNRRGSTAVEFALLVPVLLALAGGVVTTSWVLVAYASLIDAVGEGTRRASVVMREPTSDEDYGPLIQNVAETEIKALTEEAGWNPNEIVVAVGFGNRAGISHVTVQAKAPLSSRWGGLLFPVPYSLAYETTLATLDQP